MNNMVIPMGVVSEAQDRQQREEALKAKVDTLANTVTAIKQAVDVLTKTLVENKEKIEAVDVLTKTLVENKEKIEALFQAKQLVTDALIERCRDIDAKIKKLSSRPLPANASLEVIDSMCEMINSAVGKMYELGKGIDKIENKITDKRIELSRAKNVFDLAEATALAFPDASADLSNDTKRKAYVKTKTQVETQAINKIENEILELQGSKMEIQRDYDIQQNRYSAAKIRLENASAVLLYYAKS